MLLQQTNSYFKFAYYILLMTNAYNFLASWQLFPEKGSYENGDKPKSGYCQITAKTDDKKSLTINRSWVTLENNSFSSSYDVTLDNSLQPFADSNFATHVRGKVLTSIVFEVVFEKDSETIVEVLHEIQPNGYLKVTQTGQADGKPFVNVEYYHKQMSVLPYSASVSGAVIKATEEGVIRHKALTAMEEQTNMQLDQIRKQIELLALQAQEIQARKELSMMIYEAKLSFVPVIGKIYHLYKMEDDAYKISLISPQEWGRSMGRVKEHIAKVQLLADHTWKELL
jgi:Protein of unknown function (DUF2452)